MTVLMLAACIIGAALLTGSATAFAASRRRVYVGRHRAPF